MCELNQICNFFHFFKVNTTLHVALLAFSKLKKLAFYWKKVCQLISII